MKIVLEYTPILGAHRTYFLEQIHSGAKIHTIRSMKYGGLPFPCEAEHTWNTTDGGRLTTPITGAQDLSIIHLEKDSPAMKVNGYSPLLIVDGKRIRYKEAALLAKNDGFRSWEQFAEFFRDDTDVLILHFTDHRYGLEESW